MVPYCFVEQGILDAAIAAGCSIESVTFPTSIGGVPVIGEEDLSGIRMGILGGVPSKVLTTDYQIKVLVCAYSDLGFVDTLANGPAKESSSYSDIVRHIESREYVCPWTTPAEPHYVSPDLCAGEYVMEFADGVEAYPQELQDMIASRLRVNRVLVRTPFDRVPSDKLDGSWVILTVDNTISEKEDFCIGSSGEKYYHDNIDLTQFAEGDIIYSDGVPVLVKTRYGYRSPLHTKDHNDVRKLFKHLSLKEPESYEDLLAIGYSLFEHDGLKMYLRGSEGSDNLPKFLSREFGPVDKVVAWNLDPLPFMSDAIIVKIVPTVDGPGMAISGELVTKSIGIGLMDECDCFTINGNTICAMRGGEIRVSSMATFGILCRIEGRHHEEHLHPVISRMSEIRSSNDVATIGVRSYVVRPCLFEGNVDAPEGKYVVLTSSDDVVNSFAGDKDVLVISDHHFLRPGGGVVIVDDDNVKESSARGLVVCGYEFQNSIIRVARKGPTQSFDTIMTDDLTSINFAVGCNNVVTPMVFHGDGKVPHQLVREIVRRHFSPDEIVSELDYRSLLSDVRDRSMQTYAEASKEVIIAQHKALTEEVDKMVQEASDMFNSYTRLVSSIYKKRLFSDSFDVESASSAANNDFFNRIEDLDKVSYIVAEDGILHVYTKNIYVMHPVSGKWHDIGTFIISINTDASSYDTDTTVSVRNTKHLVRGYSNDYMQAPHVFNDGHMCHGNLASGVAKCYAERDFFGIIYQLIIFLSSVNIEDAAGAKIVNWPVVSEAVATGALESVDPGFIPVL